jgi:hypothetical protein
VLSRGNAFAAVAAFKAIAIRRPLANLGGELRREQVHAVDVAFARITLPESCSHQRDPIHAVVVRVRSTTSSSTVRAGLLLSRTIAQSGQT